MMRTQEPWCSLNVEIQSPSMEVLKQLRNWMPEIVSILVGSDAVVTFSQVSDNTAKKSEKKGVAA
jgi:hypothetical protein